MKKREDVAFASKIGAIAAAAGSAVGLGNIWRFPSQAAEGGGGLFVIFYLVCLCFFGVPLFISELMVGRASKQDASRCFQVLAPKTAWHWVGVIAVLVSIIVLGYYVVVCGWTLYYFWQSLTGALNHITDFQGAFNDFQANIPLQMILMVLFSILTAAIVLGGVSHGIEASCKILMPLLFLLLIGLAIRALTLPGASEGFVYLMKPDFTKLNGSVLLGALAQTFFSMSLGMGAMLTYGAYCADDMNLPKSSMTVALVNALVAVLASLMIFPSAFALAAPGENMAEILKEGGPGLLFVTVPKFMLNLPGAMIWSSAFFLLVSLAALTSTISLMEVSTATLYKKFGLSRFVSTMIILVIVIALGALCTYSPSAFIMSDYISAKILMPVGGFLVSIFVGWRMDRNLVKVQFTNGGTLPYGGGLLKAFSFILRYVAPAVIVVIFIYGFI